MAIHTLPNILRSKVNQTIEFGQFIEYNKKNLFLQKHAENEAGRLITDLFCILKKL